jgi:hypothetical protein
MVCQRGCQISWEILKVGEDLRTRMPREEAKAIYDKVAKIGELIICRPADGLIYSSLVLGSQAFDRAHG